MFEPKARTVRGCSRPQTERPGRPFWPCCPHKPNVVNVIKSGERRRLSSPTYQTSRFSITGTLGGTKDLTWNAYVLCLPLPEGSNGAMYRPVIRCLVQSRTRLRGSGYRNDLYQLTRSEKYAFVRQYCSGPDERG